MSLRLLKYGFIEGHSEEKWIPRPTSLKKKYDVVIIGGGGHGLACAYYLAKEHNITDVAVLEKNYVGAGNTGRNTTIIRSNYLTPEGVSFYNESLRLFKNLSEELETNIFYSERGHYTLAHSESTLRTARWRAEVNKHLSVKSEVVGPEEVKKACPEIDLNCGGNHAIEGALFHAPGAVARHDAVAWGYAKNASALGVEIHQNTEALDVKIESGEVKAVKTSHGEIETNVVLSAVAGYTPRLLNLVGLRSPIDIYPLQACVTEPIKPWLNTIIVSGSLHLYISQSARGELVMGASVDPMELHNNRSTFEFVSDLSDQILDLFPFLSSLKINRQWAGMADMTPDFAPVMGTTPVKGFFLDAGWGTWGFKATPVSGKTMANTIAMNSDDPLIKSFNLDRFENFQLVGEKGAAAVGH